MNKDCSMDGSGVRNGGIPGSFGLFLGLAAVAIALLCGITAASGDTDAATSGDCGENAQFDITGGTLTVSVKDPSAAGTMENHWSPDDYPWFHESFSEIVIGPGITNIGDFAFRECAGVSVEVGKDVKVIQSYAFYKCDNLITVTFDAGSVLSKIETHAFEKCTVLHNISLPDGVRMIGSYAFGSTGITGISIPSGVDLIATATFLNCNGLTAVIIPAHVTGIGAGAFAQCDNLEAVYFEEGSQLVDLGEESFMYCPKLTTFQIPSGVTEIRDLTFMCSGLKEVVIPSAVASIGHAAFYLYNLESVTFEGSVEDEIVICGKKTLETSEYPFLPVPSFPSVSAFSKDMFDADIDMIYERTDAEDHEYNVRGHTYLLGHPDAPGALTELFVAFNANGGVSEADKESVNTAGKLPELPVAVRDGYRLIGWFTAEQGGEMIRSSHVFETFCTVYAHWVEIRTVTFDANGHGTSPGAFEVDIGTRTEKPSDPVCKGYRFSGWYKEAACVNAWDFDAAVNENITLFAKWLKVEEARHGENAKVNIPVDVSKIQKVTVDGKVLDASKFRKNASGDAEIEIYSDYLKTLGEGDHTLVVQTEDGDFLFALVILPEETRNTDFAPWAIMGGCLGLLVLAVAAGVIVGRRN